MYEKDGIKIYNANCLEVLSELENVDLILTDPPFGINYQNNFTKKLKKKLEGDNKNFSYKPWVKLSYPLLKENSCLLSFSCWSEYPKHYEDIKSVGFTMKEPLIVQKRPSGTTDLYGSFQSNSDWIIFAHKERFKFKTTNLLKNKKAGTVPNIGRKPVPQYKTRFPSCWFGKEFPWSTENPQSIKEFEHPTVKSIKLMRWLILLTTNPGDVILDPFMGIGSTLIAAKQTGRKAIGIEINKDFCDVAIERLKD